MDRLYRVFNELGIACYLLFDYDKDSKDPEIVAKSRELLDLVGVDSGPPEGILVTPFAACFPRKWELDLYDEIPDVENLTANARSALGLSKDTGKPLVARYIAKQLVSQEPRVIPPSLAKMIEHAVKVEWRKSCLSARREESVPVGA